jgi:hypothetical protein
VKTVRELSVAGPCIAAEWGSATPINGQRYFLTDHCQSAILQSGPGCPGCSVLRLRSNKITNEQTTQLAKRPICRRPQRSSMRSSLASSRLRGY